MKKVKKFHYCVAMSLLMAGFIYTGNTRKASADPGGILQAVAFTPQTSPSSSGINANEVGIKVSPNGKIKLAVAGYYGNRELADLVTNRVNVVLGSNARFDVYERSNLQDVMDEKRLMELFGDPRQAKSLRNIVPVPYLVYGKVLSASCPITRETKYDKKSHRSYEVYSAKATISLSHRITDVATGRIVAQFATSGFATYSSGSVYSAAVRPSTSVLMDSACADAVSRLVRRIIPAGVQGSVVALLPDRQVMIDLGSKDGVGMDVDLLFVRGTVLKDKDGNPIMLNGKSMPGLMRPFHVEKKKKQIVIEFRKMDSYGLCVAHPVRIEEDFCIADVGTNDESFFSSRFKKKDKFYEAVKKGDAVIMVARPDDIK